MASAASPASMPTDWATAGETITLVNANGDLIQRLTYSDDGPWPSRADGAGSSLEWRGQPGDANLPSAWRASDRFGGTPGAANQVLPRDVVLNELRANSDAPTVDAIELYNTSNQPIDVSGWFISDSGSNPLRYRIPANTVLPAGGFWTVDQNQFQFNFRGDTGDDAYLIAVDAAGHPVRFADYVAFGPTAANLSIGRYPDGSGAVLPLEAPTFGLSQSPTGGGSAG